MIGIPVSPDVQHPRLREMNGGNDVPATVRVHNGMTTAERVAAGVGTAEDRAIIEQTNREHRAWLESPAGRAWVDSQLEAR